MSAELTWCLVRGFNAHMYKRDGIVLAREPANVAGRHSFKFSGLGAQPSLKIVPAPAGGVAIAMRKRNAPATAVAGAWANVGVVKAGASPAVRATRLGRLMQANGFRLDIEAEAKARLAALLAAQKKQLPKSAGGKVYRKKLAKLARV